MAMCFWDVLIGDYVFLTGLTALKSDEVYDLMLKDYPERYQVTMVTMNVPVTV